MDEKWLKGWQKVKALINIDYTYHFVAEAGALTCGEPGQRIEGKIAELTKVKSKDLSSLLICSIRSIVNLKNGDKNIRIL